MNQESAPLAERIRPKSLDEFVGQEHLVGPEGVIRKIIATGSLPSIIFWGPPGVGKTTLAQIIANSMDAQFYTLSAVSSGVKDVRKVIDSARFHARTILFIDEIHRFSKSQQDALLGAVEKGVITLIGATTENPSFEVISALLSRCQIYVLKPLTEEHLKHLLSTAIEKDEILQTKRIRIEEYQALFNISGGDARKILNLLELTIDSLAGENEIVILNSAVTSAAQQRIALYDKGGESHYDIISAFIKSLRGSDPNGAVYWLGRMIEGGEDIKFIARRMAIFASEDIGNANPTALVLATNCFQAVAMIGYPEAEIILAQCATYLASSAKSNASYVAIMAAKTKIRETGDLPVPLHLRNAPTKLMKDEGYGKGYKYPHNFDSNFTPQEYLPEPLKGEKFYDPGANPREDELRRRLKSLWGAKYDY